MRVVQFPASDSYLGDHVVRMCVANDGDPSETILSGRYENIDDFVSDLGEVGAGFYTLFHETLRYNNIPATYNSASMLHQFDSAIAHVSSPQTSDYTLNGSLTMFGHAYPIPSNIVVDNGGNTTYIHNVGGMVTSIWLSDTPLGAEYSFAIALPVIKESQISGGKFNFDDGNNTVGRLFYTVSKQGNYYICQLSYNNSAGTMPSFAYDGLNGQTADEVENEDDPYNPDDDEGSGEGGGDGTHDGTSDNNEEPALPSLTAVATGFLTLFNPSVQQLRDLSNYMWSTLSIADATAIRKCVANPIDTILGLSIVPVSVPSAGGEVVKVGGISTGVSMTKVNTQYVKVECGSINIEEFWGSFMDYSPYTKISLFLPYIGFVDLNTDLIQKKTLKVNYHVDILSGGCIAYVLANDNVIAQYSGQCAVSIPITASDWTQTLMAVGQLVASGVSFVASGGLSAPVSASMIGGVATAMSNTANTAMSSKPHIQKSGNISGGAGLLGSRKPFLIIERPNACKPLYQNKLMGYPSFISDKLRNFKGFTQVQDCKLDNLSCTDSERNEIMRLLHEGVIL